MRTSRYIPVLLLAALLASGCASTQKRFDKAADLEARGEWTEAARYYIKVLDKEPDWEEARIRLQDVGDRAVAAYLAEASAEANRGAYEDALRTLSRLDDLRDEARSVGVTLAVPDNYASYQTDLRQRAFIALSRQADEAEQRGDWQAALQAYERAERYATADQQTTLRDARGRVHFKWAENDIEREHYRAAFEQAAIVLELLGPDHPLGQRALALQEAALAGGTQYVAFLPLWQTEAAERAAPAEFLPDLNDGLLYDHWSEPVPFIAAADPLALRREMRRLRFDRRIITRKQAVEIGRAAAADYVVVGEVVEVNRDERIRKERTREARFKGRRSTNGTSGRDTSFVEQDLTLEIEAEVEYRIFDTRTRREVYKSKVSVDVSDRVKRGVFAGDYRDLDLSGSELALFEDAHLALLDLTDELVDKLALSYAESVTDRLLRLIP